MRKFIKKIPVLGPIASAVCRKLFPQKPFVSSGQYWKERYESGGTSGNGSYNRLAEFKAEIINDFVLKEGVRTVIEFGCGDGNQLKLAEYPFYFGFDISPKAIAFCRQIFADDHRKQFKLMDEYADETAELALSLDVIYHLVEDHVFREYMNQLFSSSTAFVIIYSSDTDSNPAPQAPHVRHRHFTEWVRENRPEWELIHHIPNRYPYKGDNATGSHSDFFIFRKR